MPAGTYNFTIEQGTTFQLTLTWEANSAPVNVTGYSARMQIRSSIAAATTLLDLTSATNGGITVGGSNGIITINLTDTQTSAITWTTGVYDLELVSGSGNVKRLLKGTVTVDPEVTR